MTLMKTLAWRRSPLTSTWVMLAKPTQGSPLRFDALLCVCFDDITDFKVVEIFEDDTAFVASGDLAYVVFATAQGTDLTIEDFCILTQDACLGRACDFAVGDTTASNDQIFPGLEGLHYFGVAFDYLVVGRFQHAGEGGLNIINELVNDIVVANIDAFFLRLALCCSVGFDVEANDDSARGRGKVNIGFVDVANAFVDEAYFNIFFTDFCQSVFDGLRGALNVALEHNIQFFDLALLHLHVEGVEADLTKRHALTASLFGNLSRQLLRGAFVDDDLEAIACIGHFGQAEDADWRAGGRLLDAFAAVVEHGTNFARHRADDNVIAHFERSLLDQYGGGRAGALL